jgi:hypothetical protein
MVVGFCCLGFDRLSHRGGGGSFDRLSHHIIAAVAELVEALGDAVGANNYSPSRVSSLLSPGRAGKGE